MVRIESRDYQCIITYSFKHTRSTLRMPSFDAAPELLAIIENAIEVVLIMDRPRYAVSKHAFSERRKRIDWIVSKESGGSGGVSFAASWIFGGPELEEFVFR